MSLGSSITTLLIPKSRTLHITATSVGKCSGILCRSIPGMSLSHVQCLIDLGAVYLRQEQNQIMKRLINDADVCIGDYIRVSTLPRRYRKSNQISWNDTIIMNNADFVVINKPSGIPSNPTGDNVQENVLVHMQKQQKIDPLYLPHRLDTDTSGILVMAKTKAFATFLGKLLKSRDVSVVKRYRCLLACKGDIMNSNLWQTWRSTEQQSIQIDHFLLPSKQSRKHYSSIFLQGSLPCSLKLQSRSQPLTMCIEEWLQWSESLPHENKLRKAMYWWLTSSFIGCNSNKNNDKCFSSSYEHLSEEGMKSISFWEVDLQLITGRTHQCRGQLHHQDMDLHIAGDNLYNGATSSVSKDMYSSSPFLALQSCYFSFRNRQDRQKQECFQLDTCWWEELSTLLSTHSRMEINSHASIRQ